ncbi:MAG: ABC transporter permease [Erysipelotrichaceae bacterium]|nr:ABC transporter permease [Erysipelotrichaceae bacterium]
MKDPLRKRYLRDLKEEFGRYLVIFILMVTSIAFVSGFLVADSSMIAAYDESFEKYNIEDGNFLVNRRLNPADQKLIEGFGIRIYENFYNTISNDEKTIRVFKDRKEVNKVCLMKGRMPLKDNEIAIDRMFADNGHISVDDVLHMEEGDFTVTGLVALSDYSALFSDNSDVMFDSIAFGVGIVTDSEFAKLGKPAYSYAFKYNEPPADEEEEKQVSDELMKKLSSEIVLKSYTPQYLNRAIMFTGEDMGSDKGMIEILLYMIIVILAFIFAVTASSTIRKEMTVIGTLLASGYTRKELVIHYLTLPVIVTFVSSIVGNILGYTLMKNVCVDLYYGSYSLPTYQTIWSAEAFLKTTIIPFIMMILINLIILVYKLNMPIMNFLRRQENARANSRVLKLNRHIPFFARFRTRIFLQNIPAYLVMLVGILFANLFILFGLDFPDIMDRYEVEMKERPLAPYITMLSLPDSIRRDDHKLEATLEMLNFFNEVETENETAEKFSAYQLKSAADQTMDYHGEKVTVYGINEGSEYIDLDVSDHQVYVSQAYADKFRLKKGSTILLKEEFSDKYYRFEIDGSYDFLGSLCIFMNRDDLNEIFDLGKDTFVGYFSKDEINDINRDYIGTVIDYQALTKLSRQLKVSFGGMMDLVVYFAIIIYLTLIYVLTKTIIDNNSQSISMAKIMGYSDPEIANLYISTSTIVFVVLLIGSMPLETIGLKLLFRYMMIAKISGWFPLIVSNEIIMKVIAIALASYFTVSVIEYRRISKVPMDQALKNVE